MSEFVECQNCGRRFFGENIECPYCRDDQEARERASLANPGAGGGSLFRFLFGSFYLVLAGLVGVALLGMPRAADTSVRAFLVVEALTALVVLVGLWRRRRWARQAAIVFIVANAVLGLLSVWRRGEFAALAWGPGPLALLLFLVPFCSRQAREHYDR